MVGLLGIAILLALMFLVELPVGLAMGLVGLGGLWYLLGLEAGMSVVGTELWGTFSSYGLSVIPLFVWMGQICFYSGVNENLYNTAYTWMGRIRGGLAMSTIMACAGFAAICGSNTATAATMTAVALPEMRKRNYEPALMGGTIACGATLGVVIPPSVVLIVYGIYTEQSIGKLFWASTLPGIVMAALFCLVIYIMCLIDPDRGPAGPKTTIMQKIKAIPGAFEMIILFSLVMLGLLTGAFTPTEAGAAGSVFALVSRPDPAKIELEGICVFHSGYIEGHLHDHIDCGRGGYFGTISHHKRTAVSGHRVRFTIAGSALGDNGCNTCGLWNCRMRNGCPRVSAGFNTDLFPSCNETRLRSYLVWSNPKRGNYNGRSYSTCRNLRLCGGGDERRHSSGLGIQGRHMVSSGIRHHLDPADNLAAVGAVAAVLHKISACFQTGAIEPAYSRT